MVLYTSVDQPVAQPIVREFEQQSGIQVILVTDAEATKTVGLAERLRAERGNPQADVWWGNEPFHTINLAEEGVLSPYESPATGDIPPQFCDARHRWAGNALRARVLAAYGSTRATGLTDLTSPALKGKVAMARPTAGTTGGHVAALFVLWGNEKAEHFFHELRDNDIKLLGGNSVVADYVGQGTILLGLTDNDDVAAARREGGDASLILPDQDAFGTLMIPTTVGLVAGAKHPEAARKLIDFLLSPQVEQRLIDAGFAGWSVRGSDTIKSMMVDYQEVARAMPQAVRRAMAILEGRP